MTAIDLNADLGEGIGNDEALIGIVTSASIACGGHAGDLRTMRSCIRLARLRGVAIGACAGFPDRANFGRVRLDLPHDRIAFEMVAQVGRLLAVAREQEARVRYVKLQGALASMAAEDETLAQVVFSGINRLDPSLAVLAPDGSAQVSAAESLGMAVVSEAHADRAYVKRGVLVPYGEKGAALTRLEEVLARCLHLAEKGEIFDRNGGVFASAARSIRIRGDIEGAVELARNIRDTLTRKGVSVVSAFVG